jgi:hypothetical protein
MYQKLRGRIPERLRAKTAPYYYVPSSIWLSQERDAQDCLFKEEYHTLQRAARAVICLVLPR